MHNPSGIFAKFFHEGTLLDLDISSLTILGVREGSARTSLFAPLVRLLLRSGAALRELR